jgi:6-phosphogluconolactonase (cycloisomerase 2 family)
MISEKIKTTLGILILLVIGNVAYSQLELVQKVNTNSLNPTSIVISSDNKFVYVGGSSTIRIYERDDSTGFLNLISLFDSVNVAQGYYVYASTISPDSNFVYISVDQYIGVYQRNNITGSLTEVEIITCPNGPANVPTTSSGLIISNDNKHLYSAQRDYILHYNRNIATGQLAIVDTIEQVNYEPNFLYDVSITFNADNDLLFATGLNSISVFKRDLLSGSLQLYQRINSSDTIQNQSLAYVSESKVGEDGKFLYTISSQNGITVSQIDTITDSIAVVNSIPYTGFPEPRYLSISPNGNGLCVSSENEVTLYKIDSLNGTPILIQKYTNSSAYDLSVGGKKVFDNSGEFIYTVPYFTDTIYVYKLTRPLFDYQSDSLPLTIKEEINPIGHLFPNPTNGSLIVNLSGYYEGKIIIRNAMGEIIENTYFKETNKVNTYIQGCSGLYFVEINIGSNRFIFKVIRN